MKLLVCTAVLGAALVAGTPLAHANEDPAANPPNCSAADLEGVRAGVQASTSAYLFAHPDVNDFFDSLEGTAERPDARQGRGVHDGAPPDAGGPGRYPATPRGPQEPVR